MPTPIASATENLNKLTAFRQGVYRDLGPARDALFELADAVLLMPHAQSLAELSESPVFRRQHEMSQAETGVTPGSNRMAQGSA